MLGNRRTSVGAEGVGRDVRNPKAVRFWLGTAHRGQRSRRHIYVADPLAVQKRLTASGGHPLAYCLAEGSTALSGAMGPPRTSLTDAEHALWASYVSRIRPLPGRPRRPVATRPDPVVMPPARSGAAVTARDGPPVLAPLSIGVQPSSVDNTSWRRFRTGRLPSTRALDLHGHTAQHAFQAMVAFLRAAHAEGLRCVEVVTGQGDVLRRELPLWLNLPELRTIVLAAAHPHVTNPGSVRLLLRRTR